MNKDKEITAPDQAEGASAKVILDALPSLMGALDQSVKDIAHTALPMMLILFLPDGAMYITNTDTTAARAAVRAMVADWDQDPAPTEH